MLRRPPYGIETSRGNYSCKMLKNYIFHYPLRIDVNTELAAAHPRFAVCFQSSNFKTRSVTASSTRTAFFVVEFTCFTNTYCTLPCSRISDIVGYGCREITSLQVRSFPKSCAVYVPKICKIEHHFQHISRAVWWFSPRVGHGLHPARAFRMNAALLRMLAR